MMIRRAIDDSQGSVRTERHCSIYDVLLPQGQNKREATVEVLLDSMIYVCPRLDHSLYSVSPSFPMPWLLVEVPLLSVVDFSEYFLRLVIPSQTT
jgi:hypothetical protein